MAIALSLLFADFDSRQVMRGCIAGMSRKIVDHSLDASISSELRCLLVFSCHRIAKVRDLASKYLNRLITAFPSLMCDSPVVTSVLEVLTLLQKACEGEVLDEVRSLSL
jgi:phosphatidylinositol 4-kinase